MKGGGGGTGKEMREKGGGTWVVGKIRKRKKCVRGW